MRTPEIGAVEMCAPKVGVFETEIPEGGTAKVGFSQIEKPILYLLAVSLRRKSTTDHREHGSDVSWRPPLESLRFAIDTRWRIGFPWNGCNYLSRL